MSRIIALGWVLVFASHSVMADHWISVGSFKNRDMAEKGLLQAQTKTSEPLSVVASSSNAGINYRVSAGPYATRADAKRVLPLLSGAGLSGAWIWQLKQFASSQDSNVMRSQTDMSTSNSMMNLDLLNLPELDDAVLAREARAAESMRAEVKQPVAEELAEQAPPGYQLHRLRRD